MGREISSSYMTCLGIYNADDPERVRPSKGKYYLRDCKNISIDNTGQVSRRPGLTKVFSGEINGLYGAGDSLYAVVNGNLVVTSVSSGSGRVIRPNLGLFDTVFQDTSERLYYTNGRVLEYLENDIYYPLPDVVSTYKRKMPAGHLLEYYNGRLYVATDNVVVYSDPFSTHRYDERGAFIKFPKRVTMMKAVNDGIYFGTEDLVEFYQGNGPSTFSASTVYLYGALEGSAVFTTNLTINKKPMSGAVIFASSRGIVYAGDGGEVEPITENVFTFPNASKGASGISIDGNLVKYLFITRN